MLGFTDLQGLVFFESCKTRRDEPTSVSYPGTYSCSSLLSALQNIPFRITNMGFLYDRGSWFFRTWEMGLS